MTCWSCSKSGHYKADCFVKCITCGGKGHNSKVCTSKVFKKNIKRSSWLYGSITFSDGSVKEVSYEMIPSSLKPTLRPASVVNGIGGKQETFSGVDCNISLNDSTWMKQHTVKPAVIPGQQNLILLKRDFMEQFESGNRVGFPSRSITFTESSEL